MVLVVFIKVQDIFDIISVAILDKLLILSEKKDPKA